MSTVTNLSNSVRGRYLNDYINAVQSRRVYDLLCYPISSDREIMQRQTSITAPFLSAMSIGSTAISESVDIAPQTLRDATASLTSSSRGEAIQDSELLLLQNYTDYGARRFEVLAENMLETLEAYSLNTILAGYVSFSAAARASLDAGTSGNRCSDSTFAKAKRFMQGLKCPTAPGIASDDAGGALLAIMHPDAFYDLRTGGNVVSIAQYQKPEIIMNGELGFLDGFRIIASPFAKVFMGAGADNASNCATTLGAAANALATTATVASGTNIEDGSWLTVGTEETSTTYYPMNERVRYYSGADTTTLTFVGQSPNGGLRYDHASGVAVRNGDSVYPIIFGGPQSVAKAYASDVGEYGQVVGPKMQGLADQWVSLAWKWYGGYGIISQNWLCRAEVSSSLDA